MPGSREIADAMSFAPLRYSQVWEDHLLLEEALRVGPGDDVVSITSAGCNVLALLLHEPRHLTAVDLGPAQSALLELKLAGIRRLESRDALAALLGLRAGPRLELYDRVRPALSEAAQRHWDAHTAELAEGVAHTGRLERYIAGFHRTELPRLGIHTGVGELLALADPAEQARVFAATLAPAEDAFRQYFGRERMARDGRDPAQFRHVGDLDVGRWFWERFRWACTTLPLRTNFYLEFFLSSRYRDLEHGPPYLRTQGFQRLKGLVDRVEVVTAPLEEVLRGHPNGYSKANLSDLFEYLGADATAAMFEALCAALRPGARIAYWNLLVERASPPELRARLTPLESLAGALWRRDRSWFYRAFHVEEVAGP